MNNDTKKSIEVGILKDLCEEKIISEREMQLAIIEINKTVWKEVEKYGKSYT